MPLVLVVAMLSFVLSASPAEGAEHGRALTSPDELKELDDSLVDDVERDAIGDARVPDEGPSRWRAILVGGTIAVLATLGAHVWGQAAGTIVYYATFATVAVGSFAITGGLPDPYLSSFVGYLVAAIAHFVVFTLCMAFAIDLVTDGWIALVVAPMLCIVAVLGPPSGLLLGAALALATVQLGFLLVPYFPLPNGPSGVEWVLLGVAILGITVSSLLGGLVGVATTSFVLPASVVTLLADDPAEWRTPFTSFTE